MRQYHPDSAKSMQAESVDNSQNSEWYTGSTSVLCTDLCESCKEGAALVSQSATRPDMVRMTKNRDRDRVKLRIECKPDRVHLNVSGWAEGARKIRGGIWWGRNLDGA